MIDQEEFIFGEDFRKEFNSPPYFWYQNTHDVWNFLLNASKLDNEFVLVTHNSDNCVDQHMSDFIDEKLPNLKFWFAQNVDCINKRIKSIPIGLENKQNWVKFSKPDLINKLQKNEQIPTKLAYANFSLWTNPTERRKCHDFVVKSNFITDKCEYSVDQDKYHDWASEVLDHEYVLCPNGNGIDTHRLWETLYLGRIPITIRNANTRFYEDLPALYIHDWSEVTEDLLISKLDWFKEKKNFNFEKLKMNYWKKIIYEKLNKKPK